MGVRRLVKLGTTSTIINQLSTFLLAPLSTVTSIHQLTTVKFFYKLTTVTSYKFTAVTSIQKPTSLQVFEGLVPGGKTISQIKNFNSADDEIFFSKLNRCEKQIRNTAGDETGLFCSTSLPLGGFDWHFQASVHFSEQCCQ